MPELPEVETVRRMLDDHVRGRRIAGVRLSKHKLRTTVSRAIPARLRGHRIEAVGRRGKYLLIALDGELTIVSHLGMSGRWLFFPSAPETPLPHVHARIAFTDGSLLWFQDPRRFGLLKVVGAGALAREPSLAALGPDPLETPPSAAGLRERARGAKVSIKNFLLDQRRIAGIGNIYASEILFRAGVDPRRRAGAVREPEWERIAREIPAVLVEAVARMGTTFRTYRTLWNEPGGYGERLLVYDRANQACRRCGTPVRRIVQGQRATFFCPRCQPSRPGSRTAPRRRSLPSRSRAQRS